MKRHRAVWNAVIRSSVLVALVMSTGIGNAPASARPVSQLPVSGPVSAPDPEARISPEVLAKLGIVHPDTTGTDMTQLSLTVAKQVQEHGLPEAQHQQIERPEVGGLPQILSRDAASSAAVMTTIGGRFDDVVLMADVDGREDLVADHASRVDDLITYGSLFDDWMLTRAAISEHTVANGFTETVYYYGDTYGNVFISVDTTPDLYTGDPEVDDTMVLNLPTLLNAFGTLLSDDQIVITGLAINPVADLTSFPNVNGSFTPFTNQIGEILYVSFWDTGGGLRLNYGNNTIVRSGLLAFPVADLVSPAPAAPGVVSPAGFPVTMGASFGVFFTTFANVGGIAVDDNGDVYFHQADLLQFTGGNIVKLTSVDEQTGGTNPWQDRSLATNGFATVSTLNPSNGLYPNISGPIFQQTRVTNYSGTSTTFGNIVALAAGPDNALYAAVARSYVATDSPATRATEGLFTNPIGLGATPSMIISFDDKSGAFDVCSSPGNYTVINPGPFTVTLPITGSLPIADGLADVGLYGHSLAAGISNFRVFAMGDGPDARGAIIGSSTANTLKLSGFQIDYTLHSGLVVDEASKVYIISGGAPTGVGQNPSPTLGEILAFPDHQPLDRRADYIDLRGDVVPNPPSSGGNVGDGDSDRFDHIFWLAPIDQISFTPAGISGLTRGFLMYLNRTRNPNTYPNLPNGKPQGDNVSSGPILFEEFDAGHQVAGGDDQYFPYRGDDDDKAGSPITTTALAGGFEFVLKNTGQPAWNGFYLNSNGSVSFGAPAAGGIPSLAFLLSGPPRLAAAWANLNPSSRPISPTSGFTNTFPVQALGFASVNHFVARWINVPEFGKESCGSSNSFTISIYDDGTYVDENANQPLNPANPIGNNAVAFDLQEGPTDLRFYTSGGVLSYSPPRPNGNDQFCFDYGRMDMLGTASRPVLIGASIGGQALLSWAENDLSDEAHTADSNLFPVQPGLPIDFGKPGTIYEFFDQGKDGVITPTALITVTYFAPAKPNLDMRAEGTDRLLTTPVGQPDYNRDSVCFFRLTTQLFLPLSLKDF